MHHKNSCFNSDYCIYDHFQILNYSFISYGDDSQLKSDAIVKIEFSALF